MNDFSTLKGLTIPEGNVTKITAGGVVLWQKPTAAPDVPLLPEGYTQVEYIQSTGTQEIDTGYDPIASTIIEVGYEYTTISSSTYYYVFGNYNAAAKVTWRLMTNRTSAVVNAHTSADRVNVNVPAKTVNTRYDDVLSNDAYITNGTTYEITDKTVGGSNSRNLALFANYVGGRNTSMKLYYCRIKEGETLVRDFVPCLDADGVPCLYDAANKLTYYNDGTGDFQYSA